MHITFIFWLIQSFYIPDKGNLDISVDSITKDQFRHFDTLIKTTRVLCITFEII